MTDSRALFLGILRSGLWERPELFDEVPDDAAWSQILSFAKSQTVTGLIVAGIERSSLTPPSTVSLQLLQQELSLEAANHRLNAFIGKLFTRFGQWGIEAEMVKGQGIGLCYERPLWRTPGDVDLLLDGDNYRKAKERLLPLASRAEKEIVHSMHQEMMIGGSEVELHGTFHSLLSHRIDSALDSLLLESLQKCRKLEWEGGPATVCLPDPDSNVIFIFTHILQHYFTVGIGLRQICDLCRLLWVERDAIDRSLLETRLRDMDLTGEWKAFGVLCVDFLGLPAEAMPLYDASCKAKAGRILDYIFKTGNFGHHRDDKTSAGPSKVFILRKAESLLTRIGDFFRYHLTTFPAHSVKFLAYSTFVLFKSALKGV